MRLKILVRPTGAIDGISLDQFRVGEVYELGTYVGCVFLVERWAELVSGDGAAVFADPPAVPTIMPLVLVVDDDPDVRHLTESLLSGHGYRVMLAEHGRDAIQRLRERCPDLIVLDLNMPVMDGWGFRAEQRYLPDATSAAAPVLVLSGKDDAATHAGRLGAVGVIKKPFDPDDLLAAVSAAIGSHTSAPDGIGSMPQRALRTRRNGSSTIRAGRTPS
jgi:CheY-like chemotaxis protein